MIEDKATEKWKELVKRAGGMVDMGAYEPKSKVSLPADKVTVKAGKKGGKK